MAVLALLGTGCELRQDVAISLNPDSSGQVSITTLMDEELLGAVGSGTGIDDVIVEMEAAGWSAEPAQDSGFRGFTATARFEDQLEFTSLADDLERQGSMLDTLSYTIVGDVATFDAGVTTGDGSVGFVFTLVVDMPGKVQTASAGSVSGNRVTWVISSDQSFSYYEHLTVTSDVGGSIGGSLGPWFILVVSVVLLLGLVAYSMPGLSSQQDQSVGHASAANAYNPVKQFVGTKETAGDPPTVTSPSRDTQPFESARRFCTSCGVPLQATDRFCPSCGASSVSTSGRESDRT